MNKLSLEWIPGAFAICRLGSRDQLPEWLGGSEPLFLSVTRTDRELSIMVPQEKVPADVQAERGWVAIRVMGKLDFKVVGLLAGLTGALAEAGLPVMAISTYDTDVLLVKATDVGRAVEALGVVADCSALS